MRFVIIIILKWLMYKLANCSKDNEKIIMLDLPLLSTTRNRGPILDEENQKQHEKIN